MSRYAVKKRRRGKKRCQARRWKVKKKKKRRSSREWGSSRGTDSTVPRERCLPRPRTAEADEFDGDLRKLQSSAVNRRRRPAPPKLGPAALYRDPNYQGNEP